MRSLIKSGLRRLAGVREAQRPRGDRDATVIAVAAQKGGVGKTTSCVSLAAGLARFQDLRVLVVDLDPQGHVVTALRNQVRPGGGRLSDVLTNEAGNADIVDIVTQTAIPNLDVTPIDPQLGNTEDLLGTRIGKEFILRDALTVARTHYDVILLDCPPNLGNLTLNGLVAADQVIIPCDPSPLALTGVESLVKTITTVASRLNPEIDVLGVLLTRLDGRNKALNEAMVGEIEQVYGDALLPVRIGTSTSLAKAQTDGVDIFAYDDSSRAAEQYKDLAAHVVGAIHKPRWNQVTD